MVQIRLVIGLLLASVLWTSCSKEINDVMAYDCEFALSDSSTFHPKHGVLQNFLEEKVNAGLTGVMMSVRTPDGKRWTGAAGQIDIDNNVNFRPCHQSRIGSVTKTFTATLILQLVENGLLGLEQTIDNYLPEEITNKIDNGSKITLRNLLNHSSGIRDYTTISGYTEFINNPTKVFTTQEYLELNVFDKKALFEPGAGFEYSNANYGLLGLIAERITNQSLNDLYQENIFVPLGLSKTSYSKVNPTPNQLARGYADFNNDGKIFETTDWGVLIISPAAGIISNTTDLLIFGEGLHNGELLSDSIYNEMISFIDVPEPKFGRNKYGLGLRLWETDFGQAYGHSGGMYGYLAEAFYFPESKATYILLVNCSFGICNEIVDEELNQEVLKIIFE